MHSLTRVTVSRSSSWHVCVGVLTSIYYDETQGFADHPLGYAHPLIVQGAFVRVRRSSALHQSWKRKVGTLARRSEDIRNKRWRVTEFRQLLRRWAPVLKIKIGAILAYRSIYNSTLRRNKLQQGKKIHYPTTHPTTSRSSMEESDVRPRLARGI